MPKNHPACVYCPSGVGTTQDHIPPKSLFASPRPQNIITVPCCEACRTRDAKDDEFILHLFTSLQETEGHPDLIKEIHGNKHRAWEKSQHKLELLMQVTIATPYGPAFNINDKRVDRFMHRSAKAITHDAFNTGYIETKAEWLLTPPELKAFFPNPPDFLAHKQVGTVFAYIANFHESEESHFVHLSFYGGFYASVKLSKVSASA